MRNRLSIAIRAAGIAACSPSGQAETPPDRPECHFGAMIRFIENNETGDVE